MSAAFVGSDRQCDEPHDTGQGHEADDDNKGGFDVLAERAEAGHGVLREQLSYGLFFAVASGVDAA
jgi:hypothetical protein